MLSIPGPFLPHSEMNRSTLQALVPLQNHPAAIVCCPDPSLFHSLLINNLDSQGTLMELRLGEGGPAAQSPSSR